MVALSPETKKNIDHILSTAVQSKQAPALVYGVTSVDDELYFGHAGTKALDDPTSEEVNEDSIFWICSQTKFIASIAVLQLVEQGKISLDTPVSQILPELANPTIVDVTSSNTRVSEVDITLLHLLNHSSGLAYEDGTPPHALPVPYTTRYPQDGAITAFFNVIRGPFPSQPLKFEPGTSYAYGYSSDAIGFIVERISGQTLEEYCKDHIFGPLGMASTSFYLTPELKARLVPLSFRQADGSLTDWADQTTLIEADPSKVHVHLGGTGLYSSQRDYLTLLRHILQIKAGRATSPILGIETVHNLFQPTLSDAGAKSLNLFLNGTDYQWSTALSVNTTDWPGRRRKGSGWWGGWANTNFFLDPTTGIAVVLGTQFIPPLDLEMLKVGMELEQALYAGLEA